MRRTGTAPAAVRALPALALAMLGVAALGSAAPAAAQQRIAEVQVAPNFLMVRPGARARLVATAYDGDGVPVDAPVRWTSSNLNVVKISAEGLAEAVAPGAAIVRATFQSDGRRRMGQATVWVLHPDTARGRPGAPREPGPEVGPREPRRGEPPPGRPAPEIGPPGELPPRPPGAPFRRPPPHLDSLMRAAVDCAEPFVNVANPLRACWDTRPAARSPVLAARPEECPGVVRPVRLMALVSEAGSVEEVRVVVPSNCPSYTDTVIAATRRASFRPATQGERPVRAWAQLLVGP